MELLLPQPGTKRTDPNERQGVSGQSAKRTRQLVRNNRIIMTHQIFAVDEILAVVLLWGTVFVLSVTAVQHRWRRQMHSSKSDKAITASIPIPPVFKDMGSQRSEITYVMVSSSWI